MDVVTDVRLVIKADGSVLIQKEMSEIKTEHGDDIYWLSAEWVDASIELEDRK